MTILISNIKIVVIYWHRLLEDTLSKTLKTFPATIITSLRQSGKSTLLKNYFYNKVSFISLDNINFRQLLNSNPYSYLKNQKKSVAIDEIQYIPEILSYIKILIDENGILGQWIITG
jgi:predicted AAA+ superfamily ATPase